MHKKGYPSLKRFELLLLVSMLGFAIFWLLSGDGILEAALVVVQSVYALVLYYNDNRGE